MMPAAALADDPRDPTMRSAAARARDHEAIRQLNLQELAMVRHRDSQYGQGWGAVRGNGNSADNSAEYNGDSQAHERAMADYVRSRAQYQREMAEWRRAVAECRQGNYSACDN
jgi:hypothetical protein